MREFHPLVTFSTSLFNTARGFQQRISSCFSINWALSQFRACSFCAKISHLIRHKTLFETSAASIYAACIKSACPERLGVFFSHLCSRTLGRGHALCGRNKQREVETSWPESNQVSFPPPPSHVERSWCSTYHLVRIH